MSIFVLAALVIVAGLAVTAVSSHNKTIGLAAGVSFAVFIFFYYKWYSSFFLYSYFILCLFSYFSYFFINTVTHGFPFLYFEKYPAFAGVLLLLFQKQSEISGLFFYRDALFPD